MDRVLYNSSGGDPVFLKDFNYNFSGITNFLEDYYKQFSSNMIISGCEINGSIMSPGWVFINNEIVKVEQHTITGNYFQIINNQSSTTFYDGSVKVYKNKKRATCSANSGTLSKNSIRFNTFFVGDTNIYESEIITPSTATTYQWASATVVPYILHTYNVPTNWSEKQRLIGYQFKYNTRSNLVPGVTIIQTDGWQIGLRVNGVLIESKFIAGWVQTQSGRQDDSTIANSAANFWNSVTIMDHIRYRTVFKEATIKAGDLVEWILFNDDTKYDMVMSQTRWDIKPLIK